MKRKSYYFLFVLYILMLGFILYINGVFTGEIGSISNFAINLTFFILIGILMIISAVFFNRLNRTGDALERVAKSMSTQYEVSSANLWSQYKEKMCIRDRIQTLLQAKGLLLVLVGILIYALILGISYRISVRIIEKREF